MNNWSLLLLALAAVFNPITSYRSERNLVDGRQQCCDRQTHTLHRDSTYFYGPDQSIKVSSPVRRLNAEDVTRETTQYRQLKQRDTVATRLSSNRSLRSVRETDVRRSHSILTQSNRLQYHSKRFIGDNNSERLYNLGVSVHYDNVRNNGFSLSHSLFKDVRTNSPNIEHQVKGYSRARRDISPENTKRLATIWAVRDNLRTKIDVSRISRQLSARERINGLQRETSSRDEARRYVDMDRRNMQDTRSMHMNRRNMRKIRSMPIYGRNIRNMRSIRIQIQRQVIQDTRPMKTRREVGSMQMGRRDIRDTRLTQMESRDMRNIRSPQMDRTVIRLVRLMQMDGNDIRESRSTQTDRRDLRDNIPMPITKSEMRENSKNIRDLQSPMERRDVWDTRSMQMHGRGVRDARSVQMDRRDVRDARTVQMDRRDGRDARTVQMDRRRVRDARSMQMDRRDVRAARSMQMDRRHVRGARSMQMDRRDVRNARSVQMDRRDVRDTEPMQLDRKDVRDTRSMQRRDVRDAKSMQMDHKVVRGVRSMQIERRYVRVYKPLQTQRRDMQDTWSMQIKRSHVRDTRSMQMERRNVRDARLMQMDRRDERDAMSMQIDRTRNSKKVGKIEVRDSRSVNVRDTGHRIFENRENMRYSEPQAIKTINGQFIRERRMDSRASRNTNRQTEQRASSANRSNSKLNRFVEEILAVPETDTTRQQNANSNKIVSRQRDTVNARFKTIGSARIPDVSIKKNATEAEYFAGWQYIVYTMQFAYICGLIVQLLTLNRTAKSKTNLLRWWMPSSQKLIKVD